MRQGEILTGISLVDENGNKMTESRVAAAKGISQVVFSRIFMALPGMSKYLSLAKEMKNVTHSLIPTFES